MLEADTGLVAKLCRNKEIPPKPQILVDLHALMRHDYPDILEMSKLLSHDVGLSAAVLKTVNSAFFGLRRHVADIRQAVVLLGADKVANLVSAYAMRRSLQARASISLERFWDTASEVADVSALVVKHADVGFPVEDMFTVGLFHNCGVAIMAMCFPDYQDVLRLSNEDYERPCTRIEEERYGFSQATVGYMLTESWDLPPVLCEIILQYHEPDVWDSLEQSGAVLAVAVLLLAQHIVERARRGRNYVEWPRSRAAAMHVLGLEDASLEELVSDVRHSWLHQD